MSCCGGNCGCGSDCKCKGCNGCGMYPDIEIETTSTATLITGVAPAMMYADNDEMSFGAEGGQACKCGQNCKCDPCTC